MKKRGKSAILATLLLTRPIQLGTALMLWFKNLLIYRLNRDTPLAADEIEQQLRQQTFTPCGSLDKEKTGWVSPLGAQHASLLHSANGQIILCAQKEEKILPTPVVKQALDAKINQLEGEQQRKLKKIEKDALKDEVLHSLLPRAFSRFSQTRLWIDTLNGLIMVDAAGTKRAEETLALLRKSLNSLPVVPLMMATPIATTLTEWVRSDSLSDAFQFLDEAELKSIAADGGVIRCKKQPLICDEIAQHLSSGKQVTQLALNWQERIQFILTEEGAIKRLKFSEILREKNQDIDSDDIAQRFDADFVLMSGELITLIQQLVEVLGGEAVR